MRSDDLEQLIQRLPDSRRELLSVARSLDIEGRSQAAVELLETAVRRSPSQPLRKALAALYQKVNRPADCAAVLEEVIARDPGDIPSLMLLAEAQIDAGELAQARKSLTKAESLGASRTGIMQVRRKLDRVQSSASGPPSKPPSGPKGPPSSGGGPPSGPPPLPGDVSAGDDDDPETEEMRSPLLDASPTDSGLESAESSIFEDGTFSNLSSQSLAEGAAALEENEESSVFDTLVNHDYEEDDPDRSFDALLSDLGVPVEGTSTIDERDETLDRSADSSLRSAGDQSEALPDEKTAAVDLDQVEGRSLVEDSHAAEDLSDESFDAAPTEVSDGASASETTDPISTPDSLTRDAPSDENADAAPMDEAPTDLSAPLPRTASDRPSAGADVGLVRDSEVEDAPAEDFPDELPTQIEPEQKKKRRRATQRHKALSREQAGMEPEPQGAPRSGHEPHDSRGEGLPRRPRRSSSEPSSGRQGQSNRQQQPSAPQPSAERPGQNSGGRRSRAQPSRRSGGAPNPSGGGASPFDQGEVPAPSRPAQQRRPTSDSPLDGVRDKAGEIWGKISAGWAGFSNKMPGSTLLVAASVVVVILLGTVLGVGAWAMSSLGDEIEDGLREARRHQRIDTYQGYLRAGQTLSNTARASSFAGSTFDAFVDELGLTSSRVEGSRATAAAELAMVTAMIEYRYEKLDTRESLARIEAAEKLGGSDPRIAAARAYRLMTEGFHGRARETLAAASQEYPRSKEIAAVNTELELATGHPRAAHASSALFRDTKQYDVYPKFLVGRVALARRKTTAEGIFRGILRDSSPKHLSARIEQSYAIRLDGDDASSLKKARDLVSPILGQHSERASTLQKARAHIAMGDSYMADTSRKKAAAQYERALTLSPSRSEVHLPLVDFYLSGGRTQKALERIDAAVEQAGSSGALSLRKARALRQHGRFEDALVTLENIDGAGADAAFLSGLCHLELDAPEEALKSFEEAVELEAENLTEAKALGLVARARAAKELDGQWLDEMDELVADSTDAPELLRASGLLLLEFAEAETGYSEQRELFEDAVEAFSKAAEKRESWHLIEYDLCRAQMRAGEGSQAFAHCKRGRKLNDRYRPGLRTAIQLAVLRGRYDDASSIAADLGNYFPDAPDVSFARVRAMVAQRELEAAEKQINRWAGKPVADSHDAKMAEGLLAFRKNDFRAALGYFQRAHEAMPRNAEAAVYYAWTAARLGEDDGEDILGDRLSDPLWGPRAWHALGELRKSQGKLRDARENFSEALGDYRKSIAPEWRESESYAELARTWAQDRGWDHYLTRRFVARARSRGDEESVAAHMINGEYDLKKRRRERDRAAGHFERVLAREPYNCQAIDYLLEIYDGLGRDEDEERIEELEEKYCN